MFVDARAVDVAPLLPNLPPSVSNMPLDTKTHAPSMEMTCSPLDLIHRFLVYEPSSRLRPTDALRHPWFTVEPGLVLPEGYTGYPPWLDGSNTTFTMENQTRTLGNLPDESSSGDRRVPHVVPTLVLALRRLGAGATTLKVWLSRRLVVVPSPTPGLSPVRLPLLATWSSLFASRVLEPYTNDVTAWTQSDK